MKKEISDQQLDRILRSLVNDGAVGESEIDSIAESPKLWWAVQANIAREREVQAAPWPPRIAKWWRWVALAGPFAALLIGAVFFFGSRRGTTVEPLATVFPERPAETATPTSVAPTAREEASLPVVAASTPLPRVMKPAVKRPVERRANEIAKTSPVKEIKTDFIALSYAQTPASGQILRVKVPRSTMVSVGLVSHVEEPSRLVDAEVLVGDDGMTHAIRFIRQ